VASSAEIIGAFNTVSFIVKLYCPTACPRADDSGPPRSQTTCTACRTGCWPDRRVIEIKHSIRDLTEVRCNVAQYLVSAFHDVAASPHDLPKVECLHRRADSVRRFNVGRVLVFHEAHCSQ
jgi:hypothetical protein